MQGYGPTWTFAAVNCCRAQLRRRHVHENNSTVPIRRTSNIIERTKVFWNGGIFSWSLQCNNGRGGGARKHKISAGSFIYKTEEVEGQRHRPRKKRRPKMNAPRPRYKRKKEKKTLALRNWNRLIKNNEMPLPPCVGTGEPNKTDANHWPRSATNAIRGWNLCYFFLLLSYWNSWEALGYGTRMFNDLFILFFFFFHFPQRPVSSTSDGGYNFQNKRE